MQNINQANISQLAQVDNEVFPEQFVEVQPPRIFGFGNPDGEISPEIIQRLSDDLHQREAQRNIGKTCKEQDIEWKERIKEKLRYKEDQDLHR